MTRDGENENSTKESVAIRICPACGTVNPAGPSEACPHLQLVRFRNLDEPLQDLLERMAAARNQFRETLGELKQFIGQATRKGEAEVVAAHKAARLSDIEALQRKAQGPLSLTHPKTDPKPKTTPKRKQRKPPTPEAVDPRQLALLIFEPPKGDA